VNRFYRLAAPAFAFATIGSLLLLARSTSFEFHGGLVTSSVYALAVQITLSLFLFTVVDDLQEPRIITPMRDVGRAASARGSTINAFHIRRSLVSFYLWYPLPAFLLAFGGSISIAALAIGLLDQLIDDTQALFSVSRLQIHARNSELGLAAVLAATVLPQLRSGGPGFFGWTIGFSAGTAIAQFVLEPDVDAYETVVVWSAVAAGICAVGIVRFGIAAFLRRRKVTTSS
jgi:hypothetical protein